MKFYGYLFILSLIIAYNAAADNRRYVWTYEYQTLSAGRGEFEQYTTLSSLDMNHSKGNTIAEHQLELEVGMTDRFDFGIYQIFKQNPGEALSYDGYKLRGRYRLGERGEYIFDPLLYLEYKGNTDFSEHEIEGKIILAKDFGKLNIAMNPIFVYEYEDKWEYQTEYALGTSYEVSEMFKFGMEAKGGKNGNYIGPVIAHGTEKFWMTIGSAFKVGTVKEGKPEFQIRLLLGVGL
ncbi:MAG: hypothetical protein HZB59_04735 [Ignavibacteriales bacterium]|nr:hypothetical protein [Ignavibacteriales bacterium]